MSSVDGLLADLASGDESLAEAASLALGQEGPAILPKLEALLHSADPDHRWWAVKTLAGTETAPVEWFIRALADAAPEVREAAALALGVHPAEAAVPALIQALGDSDTMVGTLAANALVSIAQAAVPALVAAYQNQSLGARIHILRALAEIHDPRAIPVMMKAVESSSAIINYWAKEGLDRLGMDMVYIKPV